MLKTIANFRKISRVLVLHWKTMFELIFLY
jgi:hypothetical protein